MRITVPIAAFAVLVVAIGPRMGGTPVALPGSSLVFVSEFGDPIGEGRTLSFDGIETARDGRDAVRVLADDGLGGPRYELRLQAADGKPLRPGMYAVEGRPRGGAPWLHFSGNGRACDRVDGGFEIEAIRFAPDGRVEHLRAKFEQRCNGSSAPVRGEVTIHDTPRTTAARDVLPRVRPTDRG